MSLAQTTDGTAYAIEALGNSRNQRRCHREGGEDCDWVVSSAPNTVVKMGDIPTPSLTIHAPHGGFSKPTPTD